MGFRLQGLGLGFRVQKSYHAAVLRRVGVLGCGLRVEG